MTALSGPFPSDLRPRLVTGVGIVLTIAVAGALGAFAGQVQLLAVALAGCALAGIVMVRRPDTATLLVMAILYSNAAAIAVQFHGLPYVFGASFSMLLVVPVAFYLIARREKVVATSALPWIIVYLLIEVVSALLSSDKVTSFADLLTFAIEGVVLYIFVTNAVRTPGMLRQVIWVLLLVGAFLGALSVHQQITHSYSDQYWGFAQVSSAAIQTGDQTLTGAVTQPRLAGPIGEKNRYAQIMIVLIPLGMFRIWGERRLALKGLAAACTLLIAAGAALTYSRGGAFGFAIVIGLMAALRYIKWRQILAILLVAALVLVAVPTYAQRLTTLIQLSDSATASGAALSIDQSFRDRAIAQIAAFLVFVDHPVIGAGPGMFPLLYQQYAGQVAVAENLDRQAHNLYLGIAAETGALGLGAFIMILYTTLRDLVRARRRWLGRRQDLADTATAFSLALASYMTTGIFLHLAYPRYFWALAALAGAAAYIALREPEPEPESETGPAPAGSMEAPTPAAERVGRPRTATA